MDAAGWADIPDVCAVLGVTREVLDEAVRDNNKQRLEVAGQRIRASQGHSLPGCPSGSAPGSSGTPVTLEALEASWAVSTATGAPVWHGTKLEALSEIARDGLRPMGRTHVHLAATVDAPVGKRHDVDVLLGVDPDRLRAAGIGLFQSPNGVLLARHVPPDAIVEVRPLTRRARAAGVSLRTFLNPARSVPRTRRAGRARPDEPGAEPDDRPYETGEVAHHGRVGPVEAAGLGLDIAPSIPSDPAG
jgi:putative RNA 2'-phosphotransferase